MRGTFQFIKVAMPKTLVLENVEGILDMQSDEQRSPLDLALATLRKLGYATVALKFDMGLWLQVSRKRIATTNAAVFVVVCRIPDSRTPWASPRHLLSGPLGHDCSAG